MRRVPGSPGFRIGVAKGLQPGHGSCLSGHVWKQGATFFRGGGDNRTPLIRRMSAGWGVQTPAEPPGSTALYSVRDPPRHIPSYSSKQTSMEE